MIAAAWVCLLAPLGAAVAITLGGTRWSRPRRRLSRHALGRGLVRRRGGRVLLSARRGAGDERSELSTAWTWLSAGELRRRPERPRRPALALHDAVVSGIGALIVGYSIGYMDGEDEERRYFAYMALFVFSMLLLVQSGNLLLLLVGWGLVGLCSYLLIGFHHERPSAVAAAKKAFIMNAVGDATMALAFFLLIQRTGSLSFDSAFEWSGGAAGSWAVNLVALGLLGGAVAKSAQLPLQTWLPDAMEGPTPVSALIHAATMVTAGVYLLVRTSPIFEAAPHVQDLAAGLGAATLLIAGLIALVQVDIKRVIAYSTMSQIGYMFLGAGLGAYASSMFHLMTHAFFKALLFLAAGLVIHALMGEQDMRKMGGLKRFLPGTYRAFLIGALALTGIPPLSGFFSKDSILASALAAGWYGQLLFAVGIAGAFLTGLYTFRMVFLVFGGEPSPFAREHFHQPERTAPWLWMGTAVGMLAIGAVVAGWIQIAGLWTLVSDFLDPVRRAARRAKRNAGAAREPPRGRGRDRRDRRRVGASTRPARSRVPQAAACAQCSSTSSTSTRSTTGSSTGRRSCSPARCATSSSGRVLLGSIDSLAAGARRVGTQVTELQTGLVRTYAFAIAGSVTVLALVFVWVK